MADSTLIIKTDNITTFADDTQNAVADLNTTISEIVTATNKFMNTSTGHTHDGTNSASISSGVGTLSVEDLGKLFFSVGGIT